jgi:hypothetical protein
MSGIIATSVVGIIGFVLGAILWPRILRAVGNAVFEIYFPS